MHAWKITKSLVPSLLQKITEQVGQFHDRSCLNIDIPLKFLEVRELSRSSSNMKCSVQTQAELFLPNSTSKELKCYDINSTF